MTTENTERGELAGIARQLILNPPNTVFVTDAIADAILAAGYTKPRQVTTVAELDAKPLAPLFAAAKAEALREAADHLEPSGVIWWGDEGAQVQEEGYPIRLTKLPDWLRARADNLTT